MGGWRDVWEGWMRKEKDPRDAGLYAALTRLELLVGDVLVATRGGATPSATSAPMQVTIKTAHGYLSAQPGPPDAPVTFQYRDAAGPWETFELGGLHAPAPPDVTPPDVIPPDTSPVGVDAFDLASALVASTDCPSVASLPIISAMAWIGLKDVAVDQQGYAMDFSGRDSWPGVTPPGWDGPINHTLWMGEYIGGNWYVLPIKEGLGEYCTLGPILLPGQVPDNLTYFAQSPMRGYQPRTGERVGFFCTTGDTRRMNLQPPSGAGRTNVVTVPFQAGDYAW
jgi:hypothetical protein